MRHELDDFISISIIACLTIFNSAIFKTEISITQSPDEVTIMKVYMVWDRYTNEYFSVVAGKLRVEQLGAYAYDRKYATYVLSRAKKMYHSFYRSVTSLELKEVPVMHIELTEAMYATVTDRLITSPGLSYFDGIRQLKYEQVRRYNDYVNYDDRTWAHSRRIALTTI